MFASPSQMAYQLGVHFPNVSYLKYLTMDKVQKPSSTRYYTNKLYFDNSSILMAVFF